jgi:hypothetical protein
MFLNDGQQRVQASLIGGLALGRDQQLYRRLGFLILERAAGRIERVER